MKKIKTDKELKEWFLKYCKDNKGCVVLTEQEWQLQQKFIDALQEENLDYRYDITDIACEKATEMAQGWEEQYKYEIAVLEKALDIAILELDFARNHSQSTSVECVERIEKLKNEIKTKAKERI